MLMAVNRVPAHVALWSLLAAFALGAHIAGAREPSRPAAPLLSAGRTVVGEPIAYPVNAPAKVTAAIVALAPGEDTGWHTHPAPVFGYMLEGEITVDYGPHGRKVYRAGDSLLEAIGVPHNGRNTGSTPARILAVFMGAEGLAASIAAAGPK